MKQDLKVSEDTSGLVFSINYFDCGRPGLLGNLFNYFLDPSKRTPSAIISLVDNLPSLPVWLSTDNLTVIVH